MKRDKKKRKKKKEKKQRKPNIRQKKSIDTYNLSANVFSVMIVSLNLVKYKLKAVITLISLVAKNDEHLSYID